MGPDAVGQHHEAEGEGGPHHGFAPRQEGVGRAPLGLPEHETTAQQHPDGGPGEGFVRTVVLHDEEPGLEADEKADDRAGALEEVVDRDVYGPTGHDASWIMLVNGCTR